MNGDAATWRLAAVILLAVLASTTDIRTRRVPNALTAAAVVLALGFHLYTGGLGGLLTSGLGLVAGLAIFLPVYLLGGMGAGDVKLLAAFGAWMGPAGALWTALYGAIAGGVLAVVVAMKHRYLATAMSNVGRLLTWWQVAGIRPLHDLTLEKATAPRLAYAVAISVGAMVTLWLR